MDNWDPGRKLLRLSKEGDYVTLGQTYEGTSALGQTGAGKTTALKALAQAFLRADMGALILSGKESEPRRWVGYARAAGRSNSVILVDENQCFDFIDHELSRQGLNGIGSVVDYLLAVIDIVRRCAPSPASVGDVFWTDSNRTLITNSVLPLYSAYGTVSIKSILQFVSSAPTSAQAHAGENSADNFVRQTLKKAAVDPVVPLDCATLDAVARYWISEWTATPDRTRGNMQVSLSTTLGRFLHGRLAKAFCGQSTVCPELCANGAVLVLSAPALTWNEDGIIFNMIWKYAFMRFVPSRDALPKLKRFRERGLVLWVDEASLFTQPVADRAFISHCREFRTSVVFIAQNMPTYMAKCLPNEQHAAEALIGQFGTHLFFQNSCGKTNDLAAQMIGRGLQRRANFSAGEGLTRNLGMNTGTNITQGTSSSSGGSFGPNGGASWQAGSTASTGDNWGDNRGVGSSENVSRGYSESMELLVEPAVFARNLKSGGPQNDNQVTCAWFRAGAQFKAAGGGNVLFPTFKQ